VDGRNQEGKLTNVLATKAVLANLNISLWTARKYDRKVTDKVNKDYHAEEDAGRYNKLLIAKDAIAELTNTAANARLYHHKVTQPWSESGGPRLLATANYMKHTELRKEKQKYESLADKFALAYPAMIEDAKKRLNSMFNADDYPDPSVVREKFRFDLNYLPCPDASDFRVSLSSEIMEEMKSDLEAQMKSAVEIGLKDARDRIIHTVGNMAEKLKAYQPEKGIHGNPFRDSLVENVRELVDLLPTFNLTNDKNLTKIIHRMETQLCEVDAKELRGNEAERKNVAKQAASILAEVEKFMA
jgi:hypothetical protein